MFNIPPAGWIGGSVLRRFARKLPFDVVHAQHYGGATRAYAACRRNGWPLVYEIHSLLGEEVERKRLGRGLVFRSYLAVERSVYLHAAQVIGLGEPVKQVVVTEKGVPADRVSVIYPGIDLAEYERPGKPGSIPGVLPENKVIMYVGSIVHPNQGVPILIEGRAADLRVAARCPLRPGRRSRRGRRALPCPARPARRPLDRSDRPDPRSGRRAVRTAPMSWSIPDSPVVRTIPSRARSPSISPPAARSWRPTSAIINTSWAAPARASSTPAAAGPLAEGILKVLADPDLAASLAAACGPRGPRAFRHGPQYRPLPQRLPACHRPGSKVNASGSPWMARRSSLVGQP